MITIKKLTKSILGEPLFEDVSFVLHKGDKVGLVGPNGCGKSTMMNIILGQVEADSGNVEIVGDTIGYLPQKISFEETDTIKTFLSADDQVGRPVLEKVGLDKIPDDFSVSKLSGGQKTRLALAKVLLINPSVLFLDEPTNHLDAKGLEWLEKIIDEFKGIVLIISHDRKLLDNSMNKILEIDPMNHRFVEYKGGYSDFVTEKEKFLSKQESEYKQQQKEKKRMERWLVLKKQEASVHADPAKGKQIRAMEKRLEREIYSKEISRPKYNNEIKGMHLSGNTPSPKLIARCDGVGKNLDGKWVLWDVSFEVRGEERVLLSGDNGSGKTTLLKIVCGYASPDKGKAKIGEKVRIGYFAQEHEGLDPKKTVMEEFSGVENALYTAKDPRAILGSFLFKGEDVFKKVSDLSLGERVRLIFAKLTNQENEFLVLDEPTNHLDIDSREVIEKALVEYKGAILAVSHDRYFIEKIKFDRVLKISNGIIC